MTLLSKFWSGFKSKIILRILLILLTSIISAWVCFKIGERFFFDKLFYQKSGVYGYNYVRSSDMEIVSQANVFDKISLQSRTADLRAVIQNSKNIVEIENLETPEIVPIEPKKFTPQTPLKIVVIGDSNTFGTGLKQDQRYSAILEKLLNKFIPTKVYTLAEPGNSIEDDYALYLLAKKTLNPDFIIIGILENDLILNQAKYPNSEFVRAALEEVCPQDIFASTSEDLGIYDWNGVLGVYQQSFLPIYANVCFLKKISAELAQDKNVLFFNFFDHLKQACFKKDISASSRHRAIMTEYKSILEKSGNKVIGHNPSLDDFSYVSAAEGHPSAQANKLFAQIILDELTKLGFQN